MRRIGRPPRIALHERPVDALQDLGDGQRLDDVIDLDENAAVGTHGERGADGFLRLPIDTTTTSSTLPASFRRSASSTAISSNGFIDIFTLASSTPEPSPFTLIFTL
jgi:hypothetical protein